MSRATRPDNRGTASGLYSTCQFLGAFMGGAGGGFALQHGGLAAVFGTCAFLAFGWLFLAFGMSGPQYLRSVTLGLLPDCPSAEELSTSLRALAGVREVLVLEGESLAYLQVDAHFDDSQLHGLPVRHV
jgi:MFS family permease